MALLFQHDAGIVFEPAPRATCWSVLLWRVHNLPSTNFNPAKAPAFCLNLWYELDFAGQQLPSASRFHPQPHRHLVTPGLY